MSGIDNIRSGHSLTGPNRREQRTENSASTKTGTTSTSQTKSSKNDAVSISNQSKAISEMQSQLASSPAFDNAKVQAIKEAITNGSYVVDPDKLAENMIKFEKELGGLS